MVRRDRAQTLARLRQFRKRQQSTRISELPPPRGAESSTHEGLLRCRERLRTIREKEIEKKEELDKRVREQAETDALLAKLGVKDTIWRLRERKRLESELMEEEIRKILMSDETRSLDAMTFEHLLAPSARRLRSQSSLSPSQEGRLNHIMSQSRLC